MSMNLVSELQVIYVIVVEAAGSSTSISSNVGQSHSCDFHGLYVKGCVPSGILSVFVDAFAWDSSGGVFTHLFRTVVLVLHNCEGYRDQPNNIAVI
jgi:hypothetical protein